MCAAGGTASVSLTKSPYINLITRFEIVGNCSSVENLVVKPNPRPKTSISTFGSSWVCKFEFMDHNTWNLSKTLAFHLIVWNFTILFYRHRTCKFFGKWNFLFRQVYLLIRFGIVENIREYFIIRLVVSNEILMNLSAPFIWTESSEYR